MRWVNVFAAFYSNFTCYFLLKLQLAFISLHRLSSWTSSRHPQTCLTNPFSSLWVWRFSLFFLKNLFTLNKSSMWEKFNTISVSYFYQSYNRSLFQVCDSRSLRTDAVIGEFKVRALTWVYDFYEYWTAVYCDKLGGGGTCALEIRRTQTSVSVFCFPQMDVGTIYNEHSEYMVVWFKHF